MSEAYLQQLQQQVVKLEQRLAESFAQVIDLLGMLVSTAERFYEGSHCRFVSQKASEVARRMGCSEVEVFEIQVAGLLHDIGKIGYPEPLLQKFPSEMAVEERQLYEHHPELGWHILRKHSALQEVAELVLQHHERLDGTGFPRRLREGQIQLGAAIIAVVDAFHNALYRRRRDRRLMHATTSEPPEIAQQRYLAALHHLEEKAGTFYHPRVVRVFVELVEEERRQLGQKILLTVPVNQLQPGMVLAESYYTSYGLLVIAQGELVTAEMVPSLVRFAEMGEIPRKLVVWK
ncbi:MAG: HD domain-containing protein [Candidatus Kapabacteria bacterium]|nr:HD domain-containing protein [Candidatus Kapabacteria bacterium]MCS7169651.1 HD domain-containing protein [Candidatus Kapabacteria bacterium]MDW7996242.1 HD domain-containing protein [Bacteroidota bacterium]